MTKSGRRSVALFALVLHVGVALSQHLSTGFIRADNGRFVDEECNEFLPTGLNT